MELLMSVLIVGVIVVTILLLSVATFRLVLAEEGAHGSEDRGSFPTRREIPNPSNVKRYELDEIEDVA